MRIGIGSGKMRFSAFATDSGNQSSMCVPKVISATDE
jgi:hypothetical protein